MLAFIKGRTEYIDNDMIVVENQGIGYRIRVPQHVLNETAIGEMTILHTYLYVREDAIHLYGFSTRKELETFQILLSISGIGPKVALAVLSTLSVEELYYAVFSDDTRSVTRTPGIGPKGAKRMIMELKDKLDIEEISQMGSDQQEGSGGIRPAGSGTDQSALSDAVEALISLGYSSSEAFKAVHDVPGGENMDVEQLLKEALKKMF